MAFPPLSWSHFVALCTGTLDGNPAVPISASNPLATAQAAATGTKRFASSAATNNADFAKASPGTMTQVSGTNNAATKRYLRLYDKVSAPNPAADTARKVYELPPGSAFVFDCRDAYATGIAFAITGALADLDNTSIGAGDITAFNLDYL